MNFVPTVHFTEVQAIDEVTARQNSLADLESAARRKSDVFQAEHHIESEKY